MTRDVPSRTAAALVSLLLVLTGFVMVPGSARCQEAQESAKRSKAATEDEIAKSVEQLVNDEFKIRQAAAAKLLAIGSPARKALAKVANGPDPELRASAQRLITLIDRTDFNQRLEAFAADLDGKRGITLPGWEQFNKLAGHDAAARSLFVEMQRAEGPLLAEVFGPHPTPPIALWEERLRRLASWQMSGNRGGGPSLGSLATMILLASVPEMEVSDPGVAMVASVIQRPPIIEALAKESSQQSIRRLVAGWCLNCPNHSASSVQRRLELIALSNLKEGLPLAIDVATGESPYELLPSYTRAVALLDVAQFGSADLVDKLEPLLEDDAICIPSQVQLPGQPAKHVQVRDVALIVLIHLTGQKPTDYGYPHPRLQPQHQSLLPTLQTANEQARNDALAKWKQWRSETKKEAETAKTP